MKQKNADSDPTDCDAKFCCNCERKNSYNGSNDEFYSPPRGIGFPFAARHRPLSHQADGFQLVTDPGSSKHFICPELIRGVESRMLGYTRIEPPMEIRVAGDNVLRGTAQGILKVIVRGTDEVLRTVKLSMVLVPDLKKIVFSSLAVNQKGVKTVIEKNGSSLNLGLFRVHMTRLDSMYHLGLAAAKESRRTEPTLREISGKIFDKKFVRTTLVPKKAVALSVGSININQRVVKMQ